MNDAAGTEHRAVTFIEDTLTPEEAEAVLTAGAELRPVASSSGAVRPSRS
ncbi:hypothetical protein HRW23_12910 [Streptomyces lunaelactis]|nr:hypothetical protein [Streptomyces lunaelactis]NUK04580.1 hypothetical protein [Streptomyces lunaelactis]NUK20395.1 hypothetical protein [Streptomyces lunaelactis]NUK37735.1 hypothetical protein [Streptomyces lunaelactis]NUK45684.1 hypothetical protein [Streptomyces lunaelactis]NUK61960.1 hypothetical protein [Streptomyces lunaelactis]